MAYLYRFCYEQAFGNEQMKSVKRHLEIEKMKADPEIDEHMENIDSVVEVFGTDLIMGLQGKRTVRGTNRASQERANRNRFGANILTPVAKQSWYTKLLFAQIAGFFPALTLAALLNFTVYMWAYNDEDLWNSMLIGIAVLVTGSMVYAESGKGEAILDFVGGIEEMDVTVLRNEGRKEKIPASDLVCGDIVVDMYPGAKIAADMLILKSENCIVDNEVIHRRDENNHEPRSSKTTSPHALDTENLCFRGTHIVKGKIHRALVIRVGDNTQIGRLMIIDGARKKPISPITAEMHNAQQIFMKMGIAAGFFGAGCAWVVGVSFIRAVAIGTGFGLAIMPSGLNMYLAICMRVALVRMSNIMVFNDQGELEEEYKILVKGVEFTEAIGATSCIVTDRTGILTRGKQEVAKVVVVDSEGNICPYTTGSPDMAFENSYVDAMADPEVEALHKCAILCMDEVDTVFVEKKGDPGYESRFDEQGNQYPFKTMEYEPSIQGQVERVKWETLGNKYEGALLRFFHDQREAPFRKGDSIDYAREEFPTLYEVPFTKAHGFELKVRCAHRGSIETNNKARKVYLKGKPEEVLARCDKVRMGDRYEVLDIELREQIEDMVNQLGFSGLRVVAFAESADLKYRDYGSNYPYSMDEGKDHSANFPVGCPPAPRHSNYNVNERAGQFLTFLGFICTIDPPREEVVAPVAETLKAGIRVIMCTGDHPQAATACARQLGILAADAETDQEVIMGNRYIERLIEEFPELEDEQMRVQHLATVHAVKPSEIIKSGHAKRDKDPTSANVAVVVCDKETEFQDSDWWDEKLTQYPQLILSRCQPAHKLKLVENAQRLGHIVAVTGTHSTDVPSLQASNIGVTLGPCTSAAKDAADIVINVNNFGALVAAIREGRQVFENMKKIVVYCMITCWPQLLAFMAFALFRMPLPFSIPLVLLIDFATNVVPAVGMAFEVKEMDERGGIMSRDPRNPFLDQLLTGKMFFFAFFQLGMIQACAGFYAYLVVMNDYGYPPHLMLRGGDSDYWGNYPIYCQFVGGQYVNPRGEIDKTRYPSQAPPTFEFPLWDEGDGGYVKECVFPIKNVKGKAANPASKYMTYMNSDFMSDLPTDGYDDTFKVGTAFSYDHNTGEAGPDQTSIEAIEALEAAGFYEYTPWKARLSGFWNSKWLAYDIVAGQPESFADYQIPQSKINILDAALEDKADLKAEKKLEILTGGPSLVDHEIARYFNKFPLGLWSICLEDYTMSKSEGAVWYANTQQLESVYGWNATKYSSSNCSVPGSKVVGSHAAAPLMRPLTEVSGVTQKIGEGMGIIWTEALFCNGDRSYDRLLAKHGITWDYHHERWKVDFSDVNGQLENNIDAFDFPLTTEEKDDLKTKAQNCWKVDDHVHQVHYCKDTCSIGCEQVPANDRANTTIWEGKAGYDVKQCFSISSRMSQREALYSARSAFAVAIVVCQLFAAATVKTRWQSITKLGMDNTYINFGIVIGCILLAYAVYTPFLNNIMQTRPIRFTHWLPGIPWAFVIVAFDECRKFMMRITSRVVPQTGKMKKGWVEKNSMY